MYLLPCHVDMLLFFLHQFRTMKPQTQDGLYTAFSSYQLALHVPFLLFHGLFLPMSYSDFLTINYVYLKYYQLRLYMDLLSFLYRICHCIYLRNFVCLTSLRYCIYCQNHQMILIIFLFRL